MKKPIDYKKELETAAKSMILVHEPELLIKMIARMIVQKVNVSHAGILLHNKDKDTYVLTVSRGKTGLKIPAGFARIDSDNKLIKLCKEIHQKRVLNKEAIVYDEAKKLLKKRLRPDIKADLKGALFQLEILEASVCIPSFYQSELLGLLLLGKKNNGKSFKVDELGFFTALASDVSMAIRNASLFKELEQELEKKKRLFIHTTIALAAAIDAKDHYTHGHTSRVTSLSLEIAKKLSQRNKNLFDNRFLENLHIASLLHDIGKIGIAESILNKNGPLDDEERRIMQSHPTVGTVILQPIKELQEAIYGVKYHHEKYDGSGYPEGLKGNKIPLIASIISVADTFDAMTTDRPYRKGLSKDSAIQEISKVSGKQFDPQIAAAFIELYKEGKI